MAESALEGKATCIISLNPWVTWFLFIWVSASKDDFTIKYKTFAAIMKSKGVKILAQRLLDNKAHVYGRLTIPLFEDEELLDYVKTSFNK